MEPGLPWQPVNLKNGKIDKRHHSDGGNVLQREDFFTRHLSLEEGDIFKENNPASPTTSPNVEARARRNLDTIKQVDSAVLQIPSSSFIVVKDGSLFTSMFIKQICVMSLWFFSSFTTIVLNKFILTTLDGDPGILGGSQLFMTTIFGSIMMYFPVCRQIRSRSTKSHINRYHFFKTISILGWLRFGAIACSVICLKYVAVSFSETIKSSAPLFTAVTAYFLLGEYSGILVNLSLLPIMFGLAISTSTELSFNSTGFIAAVVNNILDCVQNVFSKKLLSGDEPEFSALELQFYTSVAAAIFQMPLWFLFMDIHSKLNMLDQYMVSMLLFNGFMFYAQSLFAYLLMSLISPVTFSVSNTLKRAVLIWFSVLVFGNKVTMLSALGTFLVVAGVLMYLRARHLESIKMNKTTDKQ
ncbi:solute carrier family 35 member E2A isoform X1 [Hydra vulgaris]|uniref:Solute carrier family 35 member E2B n=1 Tax=Hydra vulgaris TaxID=6087 RepID=T2MH48_HYDVU|nr:solute carrier family 35 member E2A [Hydra vulgaris]